MHRRRNPTTTRSQRTSQTGDILLCCMTRVSRWCGVLEVESGPFEDDTPRFGATDPYPIRFNVKPVVILNTESAVPIRDPQVWPALTITNRLEPGNPYWTGFFRQSLNTFDDDDGSFLVDLLKRQQSGPEAYPLTDQDRRRLNQRQRVRTLTGEVEVSIPDAEDEELSPESRNAESDQRTNYQESIQYQAKVAQIGVEMGFHVWVPRSDKVRVMELLQPAAHEKSLRWKSRWPGINARCSRVPGSGVTGTGWQEESYVRRYAGVGDGVQFSAVLAAEVTLDEFVHLLWRAHL